MRRDAARRKATTGMISGPALAMLALLSGCGGVPAGHSGPLPIAAEFPQHAAGGRDAVAATSLGYAAFFPDERLKALIRLGLDRNRDLAIAVAQIEEARGQYRIERTDRFPELDASGDRTKSRTPSSATNSVPFTATTQSIGVSVPGFELDFWGRIRNLSRAAKSNYLATIAGERAARLALIRSIATQYWEVQEAVERTALAEATLASRREDLRIARMRLDAGVTSALDFRQTESLLTQAETELAALKLAEAQARNMLAILVGGPVPADLPAALPLARQEPATVLAEGLPSDLLEARPDVIAAEENLRAARANVAAARAAFFPSISLTGNAGYRSSDLSGLFSSDEFGWSFGPSISLPLFDWGRRKGNRDIAVARQDIAVATYEKTVQQAFREVADALSGREHLAGQVLAQEQATRAQQEIARLAETRYREGVANYLEVLDAERNLFTAEQALITLRRQELANIAALYAALGGGLAPS